MREEPFKDILRGRGVVSGVAEGKAVVTKQNLSLWGGLDPKTGVIIDKRHELFGQNVAGKVLVFPYGRGSTTGAIVLLEAVRCGKNPVAIINLKTEPILAGGAVMAKIFYGVSIPIVDRTDKDPTVAIKTNDHIIIDGYKGLIKILEP